jgi:hypothetical protein
MAQVSNLSPLAVELPEAVVLSFDQACDDLARASGSTRALLDVCIASGISLAYMGRAGKDATPEARHGAAMWSRLCIRKAAMMLGVADAAFESVYSGAVKPGDAVSIGGESKTVTAWKGYVANAGRPIKTAMERLVRDDLAEAKAELSYAEKARADAKAEAEKAEAALSAARSVATKAEAEAAKAEAEAEAAPRGAKAAAKAKAAKLRAKAESVAGESAALFDHAEDAAEYERAAMAEVKAEAARVAALQAMLPDTGRGAAAAKTDAEKWAARIDALLKDVRVTASPTGEVDAVALVAALERARWCIAGVLAD